MSSQPSVYSVTFEAAPLLDQEFGWVGRASAVINGIRVRGLGIRRTREQVHVVSYPTKRGAGGREYTVALPESRHDQELIDAAILAELRARAVLP